MTHDQNFKNLILDYPRQAIAFFAAQEAAELDESVEIIPIRQEQLKERLGDRFRELDVPLLVKWPDGRREALLFALEEHTDANRFSTHRIAHYCLDLSELCQTTRVVPVVIFLRENNHRASLELGGDYQSYLKFRYLACHLATLSYVQHRHSDNIVERLNLPNMAWSLDEKVDVYADAVKGLLSLESNIEKQLKYLDFIDIYTQLDDNEKQQYQQRYPKEFTTMTGFAERFREEGRQQGGAWLLIQQLEVRFGDLTSEQKARIESADAKSLLLWSKRVLDAESLSEVFQ